MNINGIEPKYPNFANLSRVERDAIIIQQLEILTNAMERIQKIVVEMGKKI